MTKYILRRIAYLILVFFIVSFLMYCLYNLIPSDPARNQLEGMKKSLKPEVYERMYQELREEMGLNDNILVRYARWMGLSANKQTGRLHGLLEGNFGYSSYFKKNVVEVILPPIGNTIFINIFATILALGITIPLGIYCAVHKGGKFDNFTQVFTIIGFALVAGTLAEILGSLLVLPRLLANMQSLASSFGPSAIVLLMYVPNFCFLLVFWLVARLVPKNTWSKENMSFRSLLAIFLMMYFVASLLNGAGLPPEFPFLS